MFFITFSLFYQLRKAANEVGRHANGRNKGEKRHAVLHGQSTVFDIDFNQSFGVV